MERNYINPSFSRPVGCAHGFSIVREQACGASVLTLLGWRLPSAIAWFVIAIIINTTNTVTWTRWIAHVLKKRFERLSPSIAHFDATLSILGIVGIAGVVASLLNALPATVNFCATLAVARNVLAKCVDCIRIGFSHDFVPLKQVVVRTASQLQLIGCSHFSTLSLEAQANGN